MQTILPLDNSSALRLTTARYFTPNGRSIQATGIVPDIVMEQSPLLAKGERSGGGPMLREANLPRHLEGKAGERAREKKPAENRERESESTPAAPGPGQTPSEGIDPNVKEGELGMDPQLDHALELLKSWQVFKTFVARSDG